MIVTTTKQQFNLNDLTRNELEIIHESLVIYKTKLDAEEFKDTRKSCVELFMAIDSELIKTRQPC